eukprot:1981821-Rhodomonas_salina.3
MRVRERVVRRIKERHGRENRAKPFRREGVHHRHDLEEDDESSARDQGQAVRQSPQHVHPELRRESDDFVDSLRCSSWHHPSSPASPLFILAKEATDAHTTGTASTEGGPHEARTKRKITALE